MPWYRTGTVACTQNSTTVTGTGTAFAANSRVGDALLGPDGRWYEVANIASDTVLSILPAYQGATAGAGTYAMAPMQGYVKASADQLRSIVNSFGDKLAALGTTGNYDILPVAKGGTGRSDGRAVLSEVGVVAPAALYGTQGLYMGWNGEASLGGAGNFLCNRGSGSGGFTWRSVNADNTASGPVMTYSYDGTLTIPLAVSTPKITGLTTAIAISQGGTGAVTSTGARTALGLGAGDAPTFTGIELTGAAYIDFHYNSSSADYTSRIIANSATNVTVMGAGSTGLSMGASFFPNTDGGMNCGTGQNRFASLYSVTGTINTSDAREKTAVSKLSDAEISAAMLLAAEIGSYKWLDSVVAKGEDARTHIGMTVQRAIEIMSGQGLDAMNYAFICYDEWPALEKITEEVVRGNIYSVGEPLYQNVPYSEFEQYKDFPSFTWEETSREEVIIQEARDAGNRYGFRYDQLGLFIARGQEERLARLEAKLSASGT